MRKITVTAEEKVTMIILSEDEIQEKVKKLYKDMEEPLYNRYNEIIDYLGLEPVTEFSYEKILKNFDVAFLYEILQLAVEITISTEGKYNLKENILDCLTEENLIEAIMGEPMIEAFKDSLALLPEENAYDAAHRCAMIYNLETMNDEENPFAFDDQDIHNALKKDVPFDELLPGFSEFLAKDMEEEIAEEASKRKCTVQQDDKKATEFYKDWPNVISPQYKDDKLVAFNHSVEGSELKGIDVYLKDDIDE